MPKIFPPPSAQITDKPDFNTETERLKYEKAWLENQKLWLQNQAHSENINARKRTARCLFWLIAAWLFFDIVIIFFEGFGVSISGHIFNLSDKLLITLITSTTASVIGLFAIVVRSLFPAKNKESEAPQ